MAMQSKIILGSLVAATSLSAFLLTSTTVSAENDTRSARIQVASACTMDGAVTNPHNASVTPGTYTDNIGTTVFSVVCNDAAGFGVYAIGYTDNFDGNAVMQGDGNNTIATGTATSGNTSNWAMKLATVDGTVAPTITNGYDDYSIVPSADYVKVASYPSATSASSSAVFKSSYAAYVALTQPSGTYTGQVKYVLVHPANGEAPEKDLDPLTTTFNESYKAAGKSKIAIGGNSYYRMQDMTPEICDNVTTPTAADYSDTQEIVLADSRDNKLYWIAKLKDGKCWMTQNLDLNLDSSRTYTPADTDVVSNWTPANDTIDATAGGEIVGWVDTYGAPYSVDVGDWYWTGTYYVVNDECYNIASNTNLCDYMRYGENDKFQKDPFPNNGEHGHVGNYYNFYAATANDAAGTARNNSTSICPKGWRLPGTDNGGYWDEDNDYDQLALAYYDISSSYPEDDRFLIAAPLYFVRGGSIYSGFGNEGYVGSYFSAGRENSRFPFALFHEDDGVTPTDYDDGWGYGASGFSVRCVARY